MRRPQNLGRIIDSFGDGVPAAEMVARPASRLGERGAKQAVAVMAKVIQGLERPAPFVIFALVPGGCWHGQRICGAGAARQRPLTQQPRYATVHRIAGGDAMVRTAVLAFVAGVASVAAQPVAAQDAGYRHYAQAGAGLYDDRPVRPVRRARTRIEVRPDNSANVPPGTRRECAATLVQEFRPSGTVIVPRERCWWVR